MYVVCSLRFFVRLRFVQYLHTAMSVETPAEISLGLMKQKYHLETNRAIF